MASAIIHICVAKKINERLQRNERNFYLGSIAPDLSKQLGLPKTFSHFLEGTLKEDVPNIEAFTNLYKEELHKDFELGYLVHLYTDKLWFSGFVDNLVLNNSIKLIDGTIINIKPQEVTDIIYSDYTSLNVDLIDYYDLDLSLFYEEFDYPKSIIKEIPMDKINLIVEKMGVIIENSKKEKNYIFDIDSVVDFITDATEEIYNYLIENNLVRSDI